MVKRNQNGGAEKITDETIEYLGILAKLELTNEEKKNAKRDLEEILSYVDKLNELDTSEIKPLYQMFSSGNVFREDIVTNGDNSRETLLNAPEEKESGFVVPKTIEGEDTV